MYKFQMTRKLFLHGLRIQLMYRKLIEDLTVSCIQFFRISFVLSVLKVKLFSFRIQATITSRFSCSMVYLVNLLILYNYIRDLYCNI